MGRNKKRKQKRKHCTCLPHMRADPKPTDVILTKDQLGYYIFIESFKSNLAELYDKLARGVETREEAIDIQEEIDEQEFNLSEFREKIDEEIGEARWCMENDCDEPPRTDSWVLYRGLGYISRVGYIPYPPSPPKPVKADAPPPIMTRVTQPDVPPSPPKHAKAEAVPKMEKQVIQPDVPPPKLEMAEAPPQIETQVTQSDVPPPNSAKAEPLPKMEKQVIQPNVPLLYPANAKAVPKIETQVIQPDVQTPNPAKAKAPHSNKAQVNHPKTPPSTSTAELVISKEVGKQTPEAQEPYPTALPVKPAVTTIIPPPVLMDKNTTTNAKLEESTIAEEIASDASSEIEPAPQPPIRFQCSPESFDLVKYIGSSGSFPGTSVKTTDRGQTFLVQAATRLQGARIQQNLRESHISFTTDSVKPEKCCSFVVKGLPGVTPEHKLESWLKEKLHLDVKSVERMRSRRDGRSLPYFLVTLVQSASTSSFLDCKDIMYITVQVEPLRKKKRVATCPRCQEKGHSASTCTADVKFRFCGNAHDSRSCQLPRDGAAIVPDAFGATKQSFSTTLLAASTDKVPETSSGNQLQCCKEGRREEPQPADQLQLPDIILGFIQDIVVVATRLKENLERLQEAKTPEDRARF